MKHRVSNHIRDDRFAERDALVALVEDFAENMQEKLITKWNRDGYTGWDAQGWSIEDIKVQLIKHVVKGDPVDVANLAAFWWNKMQEG